MVATGADASSIAEAACSVWRGASIALSPIIGQQGMAALYRRSLYLTRGAHPWLSAACANGGGLEDFKALQQALSSQTSASAAAANNALLCTFYDLLSNLIGASLTARLLSASLDNLSTHDAAQDPTP